MKFSMRHGLKNLKLISRKVLKNW